MALFFSQKHSLKEVCLSLLLFALVAVCAHSLIHSNVLSILLCARYPKEVPKKKLIMVCALKEPQCTGKEDKETIGCNDVWCIGDRGNAQVTRKVCVLDHAEVCCCSFLSFYFWGMRVIENIFAFIIHFYFIFSNCLFLSLAPFSVYCTILFLLIYRVFYLVGTAVSLKDLIKEIEIVFMGGHDLLVIYH